MPADARTNPYPFSVTARNHLTAQPPGLFQPNPDVVVAWKKNTSGLPHSFATTTQHAAGWPATALTGW